MTTKFVDAAEAIIMGKFIVKMHLVEIEAENQYFKHPAQK